MRTRLCVSVFAFMALAACGESTPPPAEEAQDTDVTMATDLAERTGLISDGRAIVEESCSDCHAIGATDESPRNDAPPLRTVLANRDTEALAADFREGIHVGATDMPDFDFGPLGTEAVIAYLVSMQQEVHSPDTGE
ncbi:hypothetical protein [Ponticaulis profundi]|uniref:Cytochrome c domain-containing protein n=1 Tax=Ponticaulis profundi TaxID=2665222 RepID=A0ABW1SAY4_9PROT